MLQTRNEDRPKTLVMILLSLVLILFFTSKSWATLDFEAFRTYDAPGSIDLVLADLNHDNILDVITGNLDVHYLGDPPISIRMGNGDGTFGPATDYVLEAAVSIAVADLNHDTHPDLAAANGVAVSVLIGSSNGIFDPAVNYEVGAHTTSVEIGDLNNDGHEDLVLTCYADYTSGGYWVSVMEGNGDGTFASPVNYDVGDFPRSTAIADTNGDNFLDLVVANVNSDNVSVLMNNGDGTFAAAINYATGNKPTFVTAADINNDHHVDLIVANYADNNISVFMNNGDGTFGDPVYYGVGEKPSCVAAADLNHDNQADLVVTNSYYMTSSISVLIGHGDGTFDSAVDSAAGADPYAIAIGDLNGDTHPDLASTASGISIAIGNGDGTFQTPASYATSNYPKSVDIGDFNNDNHPDLTIATWPVSVLLGNTNGTFTAAANFNAGGDDVAITDLNGDNQQDMLLLSHSGGSVSALTGNGDGTFNTAVYYPVGDLPLTFSLADLNGDTFSDLVITYDFSYENSFYFSVLLGSGDGTFQPAINDSTANTALSLGISDLDGDHIPDMVVTHLSSIDNVSVMRGNGDGTFTPAGTFTVNDIPFFAAISDLDGDHIPDLVTANTDLIGALESNTVAVLTGNGDGTFGSAVYYNVGKYPQSIAIADLDGDDIPDLAVANKNTNNVSLLTGNGDGTFAKAVNYVAGTDPIDVAIIDIDNDNRPDLVIPNNSANTVTVLINHSVFPSATAATTNLVDWND